VPFALLIGSLFECGGLLPWIVFGSHGARRHEAAPVSLPVSTRVVADAAPILATVSIVA
jgi:hypothetical protein